MKLKSIVTTIVAVGLVAGSAAGVAAQDEAADPMASSTFIGEFGGDGPPDFFEDPDTGLTTVIVPFEATDPRASGTVTNLEDFAHDENDERYRVSGTSVRIVNDGGAWVGTSRFVNAATVAPNGDDIAGGFTEYAGEGGYEGLSMFTFMTFGTEGPSMVGFIVPTDIVPTMPPPPPAAE